MPKITPEHASVELPEPVKQIKQNHKGESAKAAAKLKRKAEREKVKKPKKDKAK